jgi:hypothetical protein
MTNDEILTGAVVDSWKLVIKRFDKMLGDFTDEQLQQQIAPGKNRVFYLLGHLNAIRDRMLPMLGLGERLHPELDDAYIANGDRVLGDPLSATELRRTWTEVNDKLTAAFDQLNLQDWLEKHAAVSDADFAENSKRNRLSVVVSRTNHVSYHLGQVVLAKARNRRVRAKFQGETESLPMIGRPKARNLYVYLYQRISYRDRFRVKSPDWTGGRQLGRSLWHLAVRPKFLGLR